MVENKCFDWRQSIHSGRLSKNKISSWVTQNSTCDECVRTIFLRRSINIPRWYVTIFRPKSPKTPRLTVKRRDFFPGLPNSPRLTVEGRNLFLSHKRIRGWVCMDELSSWVTKEHAVDYVRTIYLAESFHSPRLDVQKRGFFLS